MQAERRELSLAVKHAILLAKALEETPGEKLGKGVRSRAREVPSLVLQAGFAPTLALLLSKAKTRKICEVYSYFSGSADKPPKALQEDLQGGEGSGYTTMLALILHAVNVLTENHVSPSVNEVLEYLKGLAERPEEEAKATRALLPYLIEVKKLVEALITGDE